MSFRSQLTGDVSQGREKPVVLVRQVSVTYPARTRKVWDDDLEDHVIQVIDKGGRGRRIASQLVVREEEVNDFLMAESEWERLGCLNVV